MARIKIFCYVFFTTLIASLQETNGGDPISWNRKTDEWGIQDESIKNGGFSFIESHLSTSVGTVLAKYPLLHVKSAELVDPTRHHTFIDLRLSNDSQFLEFLLARPLSEFRSSNWAASIEIEYRVYCGNPSPSNATTSSSPSFKYTFMVIIEDGNSYAPEFSQDNTYTFNVTLPTSNQLNNKKPLQIIDRDINFEYANLSVTCFEQNGSAPCDNFRLTLKEPVRKDGYVYELDLCFAEHSAINHLKVHEEVGDIFNVWIRANDSTNTVEVMLTFTVEKVLEGKAGQGGSESSESFPLAPVVGVGSAIAIMLAIGFSYTTWRNRQTKNILRKLTEAEIREFLDGAAGFSIGLPKRSVDCNTPILAMPYNKAFEIPRDRLRIDETTILGSGFFGVVMKGSILHPNGDSTTVAVKAVKRNVGVLYFKALLSELKIMAFIGRHNNIVGLVGACTQAIRKREVFIAVEFCSNGNLHNYLRAYRTGFVNLVKDGKLCGFSGNYAYNRKGSYNKQMSTLELVKWAGQIANGLDYLSSVGVIHGDLATRNILLDENLTTKIADFGLSRRLIDVSSYYYTKQSQAPLPWKWMSLESLKDMKFSKKSDIWSYGIVLWEIFTLGQTPYPGLNWDETFVERLEKGLRLHQPQFASNDLYEIMKDCWTSDPHDRPNVFDLKRILETMTNSLLNQGSEGGYLRVLGNEKSLYIGNYDSPSSVEETDDEGFSKKKQHAEC